MAGNQQLDLLAPQPAPAWLRQLRQRVNTWAGRGVYFGASSWKYEGWLGQIYSPGRYQARGRFSRREFQRRCIEEYAQWFPTVCADFAFYEFYDADYWRRLCAQTPPTFRFGVKAPETITSPVWPEHPRYGAKGGHPNENFLNAGLFNERFARPLAAVADRIGYVVLEFPRFRPSTPAANRAFLQRLDDFLPRLEPVAPYAVEIRTQNLLTDAYFQCLQRHGAAHVFNAWTWMPSIGQQLALPGAITSQLVVARVLLRPARTYEEAVKRFAPYDQIKDPYPEGYRDVAQLVRATRRQRPAARVFIAVNNRFVGNAIAAIHEILNELESA
jgi:uncharacterized protein YecE (DUF72 family)